MLSWIDFLPVVRPQPLKTMTRAVFYMGRGCAAYKGRTLVCTFKPDASKLSRGPDHLYTENRASPSQLFQQAHQLVPGLALGLFTIDRTVRVGIGGLEARFHNREIFVLR